MVPDDRPVYSVREYRECDETNYARGWWHGFLIENEVGVLIVIVFLLIRGMVK